MSDCHMADVWLSRVIYSDVNVFLPSFFLKKTFFKKLGLNTNTLFLENWVVIGNTNCTLLFVAFQFNPVVRNFPIPSFVERFVGVRCCGLCILLSYSLGTYKPP